MPVHSSTPPISRSNVHVDQMVEDPEGKMQQVRVNLGESPLSWLRARGHVSERLFLAGERLRQDWELAGLGARVTMAWDAAPSSRGRRAAPVIHEPEGGRLSARQRFHAALDRAGPGLRDILWRVVCAGEGLSAADYYRVPGV